MPRWFADDLTPRVWQGRYDIDDVYEICSQPENDDSRFELIDGELIEYPPCGLRHGVYTSEVMFNIHEANRSDDLGTVFARCGWHPPDDRFTLLGPSAAFLSRDRVPQLLPEGYAPFMPDLALEVVSFCNPRQRMPIKVRKYMENGTRLLVVVDSEDFVVEVWWLNEAHEIEVERVGADGVLTGRDVLPGFSLELSRLF